MKRVLANIVVILIAAAVVFFIGWIQFAVKAGNCGVMISKTSGVYEKPITAGEFAWRWEKLLPTNSTIYSYSLEPYKSEQVYTGTLSGSEIYSKLIEPPQNFDYEIKLLVSLSVSPENLVKLVKSNEIKDQDSLNVFFENKAKIISKVVADDVLEKNDDMGIREKALSKSALDSIVLSCKDDLSLINVNSIELVNVKLPDMDVYNKTKELYNTYKEEVEYQVKAKASDYADDIYEENKAIATLEKYAQLLKKYPQLKDVQNIKEVAKALKNFEEEKQDTIIEE